MMWSIHHSLGELNCLGHVLVLCGPQNDALPLQLLCLLGETFDAEEHAVAAADVDDGVEACEGAQVEESHADGGGGEVEERDDHPLPAYFCHTFGMFSSCFRIWAASNSRSFF